VNWELLWLAVELLQSRCPFCCPTNSIKAVVCVGCLASASRKHSSCDSDNVHDLETACCHGKPETIVTVLSALIIHCSNCIVIIYVPVDYACVYLFCLI